MSRAGGLISRIFRGLVASRQQNTRLVGVDHLGNKYYEKDPDAKRNRKGARWVECVDQEKDPTFIPELPTEWDSWLRRRRDTPPTQEELDRNYAVMVRTQRRAKELEETVGTASSTKADADAAVPYTETVTQDSFKSKFPRYDDLELRPGQLQDKNPPNK